MGQSVSEKHLCSESDAISRAWPQLVRFAVSSEHPYAWERLALRRSC